MMGRRAGETITRSEWSPQGSRNSVTRYVVWDINGEFLSARPTREEAEQWLKDYKKLKRG